MRRPRVMVWAAVLAVLVVVLFAVLIEPDHVTPPPGYPTSMDEIEPFLGHLQFLWERYLDMISLLITLLTGVIAVSAGMVKLGPRDAVAGRGYFAGGMLSLLGGLTCAVMWRVDAQLLMEVEIFGQPARVRSLFEYHGVTQPFTSSFEYLGAIQTFGCAAKILMLVTACCFVVGLMLLAWFAYNNLPETSRSVARHGG